MIVMLVYGPSGVGKTTAVKEVQKLIPQAEFASLDDVAVAFGRKMQIIGDGQDAGNLLGKLTADGFHCIGVQAAADLVTRAQGRPVVLDVGAGFLESSFAGAWLPICYSVVLDVLPETAYKRQIIRHPGESRTFEAYSAQEFSTRRIGYYSMARRRVDAEQDAKGVCRSLVQIIREMIDRDTGAITD